MSPTISDLAAYLLIPAVVALIGWLAYLGVCVYIVKKTGKTEGLKDLGTAAKGFRRISFGKTEADARKPVDSPTEPGTAISG